MPETELTPVAHHLFRALEKLRALPVSDLEREKMRTWIYQLICSALDIIVKDEVKGGADPNRDHRLERQLADDLDDLLRG
jgi:hypothetical protein